MRKSCLCWVGVLAAVTTPAQVVLDWNTPGQGYTFGTWSGNFIDAGGTRQFVSPATASGGNGTAFSVDVSGLTNARFAIRARKDAGNTARGLDIVITPAPMAANPSWISFYHIPAAAFVEGSFTTVYSELLSSPNYVLDSANSFAYVGAGSAFAPDLSKIGAIHVQGADYDNWRRFRYTLDNLEVVPEPASMAALGLGALALMRRRRR